MEKFKKFQGLGEETQTSEFFVDSNGKAWPIYKKIVDLGAGPNAGSKSVNHNVANMKADGYFAGKAYFTKAATAPVITGSSALTIVITLTQVTVADTADLTTFAGQAIIEYCKSTD